MTIRQQIEECATAIDEGEMVTYAPDPPADVPGEYKEWDVSYVLWRAAARIDYLETRVKNMKRETQGFVVSNANPVEIGSVVVRNLWQREIEGDPKVIEQAICDHVWEEFDTFRLCFECDKKEEISPNNP